jgi:hypothetical protein
MAVLNFKTKAVRIAIKEHLRHERQHPRPRAYLVEKHLLLPLGTLLDALGRLIEGLWRLVVLLPRPTPKELLYVLLVLLVALGACTPAFYNLPPVESYTGFESYVASFKSEAAARNVTLQIQRLTISTVVQITACPLGAPGTEIVGCCDGAGNITLLQSFISTIGGTPLEEEVLFHEMGHCVLEETHRPALDSNGNPTSIMNPDAYGGPFYEDNRSTLLDELFDHVGH